MLIWSFESITIYIQCNPYEKFKLNPHALIDNQHGIITNQGIIWFVTILDLEANK